MEAAIGEWLRHAPARHRNTTKDVKPANVFITSDGRVKLGDLGLGRFFNPNSVAANSLVGTPYYMSPERVQEQVYDLSSDV
uniref:NIMA-related kinase n=1 Tax=Rhipicephalus zambeziensis TaxID=60191 RepID=A0A224Z322_9ACAR